MTGAQYAPDNLKSHCGFVTVAAHLDSCLPQHLQAYFVKGGVRK